MLELNKIYNGDCLELIKEIPDGSIDLICTDPPYCVGVSSNGRKGSFEDFNLILRARNEGRRTYIYKY